MSVSYYDQALLTKIKSWVKDENMTIVGPDDNARLFREYADIGEDKPISLPLISLRRGKEIEILDTSKKALTFEGATVALNEDMGMQLRAIPIRIRYQIDIYCRYQTEADEYLRNFVFNFINYPKLAIEIPYNGLNEMHQFKVDLETTLNDNSDIPERLIEGQFTRYTIGLNISDAYLFSSRAQDNVKIGATTVEATFRENN